MKFIYGEQSKLQALNISNTGLHEVSKILQCGYYIKQKFYLQELLCA